MAVLLVEDGDFIKHHPGCHYYKAQTVSRLDEDADIEQDLWRFFNPVLG